MKAIFKAPGKPAEIIEVENTLEALQEKVGGYIEAVRVTAEHVVICNEEGRLLGLPENMEIFGISFVGPILVVSTDGGEEFCDVTRPEIMMEMLGGSRA